MTAAPASASISTTNRADEARWHDLVSKVDSETLNQVRGLSIHDREGRLVVTGQSRSYYVKQLVTRAILATVPQMRLVNDIRVC